jgi:hypothetical protein
MNAGRQISKSNLRSFFSSIPVIESSPTKPDTVLTKLRSKGKSKKGVSQQQPGTKVVPYKKKKITGALREAVWIKTMGKVFEGKCPVVWCPNTITVFDFQSGHNIPESKGGSTTLPNLIPICARCNFSMGNQYTIDAWNALHSASTSASTSTSTSISALVKVNVHPPRQSFFQRFCSCFYFFRKST